MTDKLPHQLLALFAPRPPLRWAPPPDHAPEHRHTAKITGLAQFLPALNEYKDKDGFVPTESWLQRRDRKAAEHKQEVETLLVEGPKNFKPTEDPNIRGDAFKTLIVARLSYEANEQDLEREFARYGPIERIRIIKDTHADEKGNKKKKPHRGYAFVVFEREKDMRAALDSCDGLKIKDRRIKVDVERGRTVKGWKPRRLGGGLGGREYTKATAPPGGRGGFAGAGPGGPGGGFRSGGFRERGGFGGGRDRGDRGGGFKGDRGGRNFDRGDRGDRGGDRYGGSRGGDRAFGDGPPPNAPGGPGIGRSDRRGFGNGGGYDSRDSGRPAYDDRPSSYRERDYDRGDRGDRGDRDRERDRDRGRDDRGDRDRDHGRDRGRDDRGDRDRRDRDRERDNGRRTGSNMEPVRSRDIGGYRDSGRDYERPPRDDDSRKRAFDGPPPEETRKLRRYQ